jgi:hypothetical protein
MAGEIPRRIKARRGFSVFYKGKTLLSLIDPIAQAERIVQEISPKNRTLYFCPSPLIGYGLSSLLERLGNGSAIICVETDENLMDLSAGLIGELLRDNPQKSRLNMVKTGDAGTLCAYVRNAWGSRVFRRVEVIRLTGGWRLNPELYEALAAALERDIASDWGNAMTLVKLGRRYALNTIRNLALLPKASRISEFSFHDAPVLVLGAGPSLDRLLEGLTLSFKTTVYDPKTRPFAIICVDTALPILKARDIQPNLAAALESQHWNLRDFIGLGDWELPVAMDLSALPATSRVLGERTFLFATPWTRLRFFKRLEEAKLLPETFPPLGSVGPAAVSLALRLTKGPVLTGGIDFSFTPDAFHARGAPGNLEGLRRQDRFHSLLKAETAFRRGTFPAASKSGLPVRSDPVLKNYRDLFEQEFAGEPRLRDTPGTGLPLGIKTLSQEEAFALLGGKNTPIDSLQRVHTPTACLPREAGSWVVDKAAPEAPGKMENPERAKENLTPAVQAFIKGEQNLLLELRALLTGAVPVQAEKLEALLDNADYIWAHFPDCAGAEGRRPPGTDLSFLKRVRMELDPFIRLFDLVMRETGTP